MAINSKYLSRLKELEEKKIAKDEKPIFSGMGAFYEAMKDPNSDLHDIYNPNRDEEPKESNKS